MRKTKNISSTLRHRVAFLKNIGGENSEKENWQEEFTAFASIEPISEIRTESPETLDFGHISAAKLYLFKTRFLKHINPKLRISFKHKTFEIKRIINEEERDYMLRIICLEVSCLL